MPTKAKAETCKKDVETCLKSMKETRRIKTLHKALNKVVSAQFDLMKLHDNYYNADLWDSLERAEEELEAMIRKEED